MDKINRYPGIQTFESDQRALFFGRNLDERRLYTQVRAQSLVVLFAKSGIGKSSLINAGLIPRLEEDDFYPVKIRLQDTDMSPVKALKKALEDKLNADRLNKYTQKQAENASVWEYLRACEFGTSKTEEEISEELSPVLIFDQFEEFFEHESMARQDLVLGLADLLGERLPTAIQKKYKAIPHEDRRPEDRNWYRPLDVKIVLAIRSDRLSLLDDLAIEIPVILKNRYHLKALGEEQAINAITKPAALEGDQFLSPSFSFTESTLNEILKYLKDNKGEIESFQLQLVCQHIEQEVIKRATS